MTTAAATDQNGIGRLALARPAEDQVLRLVKSNQIRIVSHAPTQAGRPASADLFDQLDTARPGNGLLWFDDATGGLDHTPALTARSGPVLADELGEEWVLLPAGLTPRDTLSGPEMPV